MGRQPKPPAPTPAASFSRPRFPALGAVAALALAPSCGPSKEWKPPPAYIQPETAPVTPEPGGTTSPAPPAATPASAIPGDLPTDLDGTLSAHAVCKEKSCPLVTVLRGAAAEDAKAPAVVSSHDIVASGHAITIPRHADLDVYGVVLRGAVTVSGVEGGRSVAAGAWTAFRAPGAGATISAREAPSRVVLAVVTSGGPVGDALAARGTAGDKAGWKARPAPLEATDLRSAADLAWGGGAMHARIGFEGDKQRASFGVLMASKDAPVPPHVHDGSWEILVALRAAGTAGKAKSPGAGTALEPVAVKDGTVVAIAKSTQHSWTPDGSKPLIALQLYVPAGPEQRFKKLAEAK